MEPARVREFNDKGLSWVRQELQRMRDDPSHDLDRSWLQDPHLSAPIKGSAEITRRRFTSRLQVADYLASALSPLPARKIELNIGLWTWLAAYYLDDTCPRNGDGGRSPLQDYRYILSRNWNHYYRHLLAGPVWIYNRLGLGAKGLLCGSVDHPGDYSESICSRVNFIGNKSLVEAADALYYDAKHDRIKRNATNRTKSGNLRRFWQVAQQFEMTYDLSTLSPRSLIKLLPSEFDGWRSSDH